MDTNKVIRIAVSNNSMLEAGTPLEILEQYCRQQATGRLQLFSSSSVCWTVRLDLGVITYVTHSVEPFDRLTCHLRLMSHKIPSITKEFRTEVALMFEDATDPVEDSLTANDELGVGYKNNDYTAICWLYTQKHLTQSQVAQLIESTSKEAIEPLLWLEEVKYRFTKQLGNTPTLCRLDLSALVSHCQQRMRLWQLLTPQIWSPYQRPYFFGQTTKQKQLLPELKLHQKFSTILKGFTFRHLAILMNKDELKIAGSLMPYICEEVVVLRDPQPPFDKLPKVPILPLKWLQKSSTPISSPKSERETQSEANLSFEEPVLTTPTISKTTYTIACVDDSPTILNEINRFLQDSNFKVISISDPLKALMQIVSIKPDLILLDVTMPKVNGYELCRLIKNKPAFKDIPIVMVTGNTSLIDRAKAKISGATDYLTKPFTQEGLLKMVFRYLS